MTWRIVEGDCRERLGDIADGSVHCIVTSPPYFGLRDYGTGSWEGGDSSCDHLAPRPGGSDSSGLANYANGLTERAIADKVDQRRQQYCGRCRRCGAMRVDRQIGLEPSPGEFVDVLVDVFRDLRRVLRDDGTVWLNLGDSYSRSAGDRNGNYGRAAHGVALPGGGRDSRRSKFAPIKDKDLIGIPWMVAFALRADGWYLRSEVVWSKSNAMPESVTDRPTSAHEKLFLLSKSPRYFYDAEAIREADSGQDHPRSVLAGQPALEPSNGLMAAHKGLRTTDGRNGTGRNKRNVWEIPTAPFADAHFATFPTKLVEPCVLAGSPPQDPRGGLR